MSASSGASGNRSAMASEMGASTASPPLMTLRMRFQSIHAPGAFEDDARHVQAEQHGFWWDAAPSWNSKLPTFQRNVS